MSTSTLCIGVSGHQHLGDETTIQFVSQRLRELLLHYREQAAQQNQEMLVYSALAIGTDQLAVKIAQDLDIPVEVVIPCAQYEEIFASTEERNEYKYLLAQSRKVHQLPGQTCSEEAFLEAGHWIVDHSDLMLLVWNGYPALGKGGTGDIASYARLRHCPFVHVHTRLHTIKQYGRISQNPVSKHIAAKRKFAVTRQTVYQGSILTIHRYHMCLPDGKEIDRDIVERPESVLVLPVGRQNTVLLIEEYDLGAETWQLTLPGGKVIDSTPDGVRKQAETELREELGYRAGRLEKLLDIYSHPGYVAHKVHLFVAFDLEWDPLEMEDREELLVRTFSLEEALQATKVDYRCDPEAALALWLYAARAQ